MEVNAICHRPTKRVRVDQWESSTPSSSSSFLKLSPSSSSSWLKQGMSSPAAVNSKHVDLFALFPLPTSTPTLPLDPKLMDLPEDLLSQCLLGGYLNSAEVLTVVSVISKPIRHLASERVHMLDLRAMEHIQVPDVELLTKRFPNLSELDFGLCSHFSDSHLFALRSLKSLQILRLGGTSVSDTGLNLFLATITAASGANSATKLLELDLSASQHIQNDNITDRSISTIVKYCPNLLSLSLSWRKSITNAGVQMIAKGLGGLEALDLSLTNLSEGVTSISCLGSLRTLDLSACCLTEALVIQLFQPGCFVNLTDLVLKFQPSSLTLKSFPVICQHLPSLRALDVRHGKLQRSNARKFWVQLQKRGVKIFSNPSIPSSSLLSWQEDPNLYEAMLDDDLSHTSPV